MRGVAVEDEDDCGKQWSKTANRTKSKCQMSFVCLVGEHLYLTDLGDTISEEDESIWADMARLLAVA